MNLYDWPFLANGYGKCPEGRNIWPMDWPFLANGMERNDQWIGTIWPTYTSNISNTIQQLYKRLNFLTKVLTIPSTGLYSLFRIFLFRN